MNRLFNLLITFILLLPFTSSAQYYEFGGGLGATLYYGDLNAPDLSTNLTNAEFGGQLLLRYLPNKYMGIRANLTLGKFSGDDRNSRLEFQKIRNLRFSSILVEGALMGEYYVFGYDAKAGTQIFSPYATAGLGLLYFNPKADLDGVMHELQPLGTEGQGLPGQAAKYSRMVLAIPFGGGFKMKINDKFNFGVELISRITFTDYIDDVSGTYANTDDLLTANGPVSQALGDRRNEALGLEDPLNTPGAQRGGAGVDDYYFTLMFNITANIESIFGLGKDKHSPDCPRF